MTETENPVTATGNVMTAAGNPTTATGTPCICMCEQIMSWHKITLLEVLSLATMLSGHYISVWSDLYTLWRILSETSTKFLKAAPAVSSLSDIYIFELKEKYICPCHIVIIHLVLFAPVWQTQYE